MSTAPITETELGVFDQILDSLRQVAPSRREFLIDLVQLHLSEEATEKPDPQYHPETPP